MKQLLISITLLLAILTKLTAQSPTYKINGVIEDTLGNSLIYSTVLLLEADSTMVDFTRTEMDGSFRFKDVPSGEHIVKSTYIGYLPLTVNASSTEGKNIDLGILSK